MAASCTSNVAHDHLHLPLCGLHKNESDCNTFTNAPTSGPFGDSMLAAARPKRWGVSRQAKCREFDPTSFEIFTLLT
jgi:hypothetical protein